MDLETCLPSLHTCSPEGFSFGTWPTNQFWMGYFRHVTFSYRIFVTGLLHNFIMCRWRTFMPALDSILPLLFLTAESVHALPGKGAASGQLWNGDNFCFSPSFALFFQTFLTTFLWSFSIIRGAETSSFRTLPGLFWIHHHYQRATCQSWFPVFLSGFSKNNFSVSPLAGMCLMLGHLKSPNHTR